MDADPGRIVAGGQLTMSDAAWEQARSRASVIGPLAERGSTGTAAVDGAAMQLGVSRRQIYVLLGRYRRGSGLVTDLAVRHSTGGKGGNRLPEAVEEIMRDLIRRRFLTRQKLSVAALHRDIVRACAVQGMKAPARNTVTRRISMLNPVEVARRREGRDSVRPLQSARGDVPRIGSILEQVQIDHTIIDVVIVDESERRSIGRPYLTVAIDVFSRTLVGMVLRLEPPSAVSGMTGMTGMTGLTLPGMMLDPACLGGRLISASAARWPKPSAKADLTQSAQRRLDEISECGYIFFS